MIKHTPQEIADFFGCYVLMSASGDWYMTTEKPDKDTLNWKIQRYNRWHKIRDFMIDPPADHDWTHLYEPQADNKDIQLGGMAMFEIDGQKIIVATKEKFLELQKKIAMKPVAPHQSEVYTHCEYRAITAFSLPSLTDRVNAAMPEGWRPQGGLLHFSEKGKDESLFYQAMVRGV